MLPRTREAGGAHRIQVIAWRRGLLDGLRHGDPAHRYLRGILAWQRGLLAGLRHGDPAPEVSRGIPAWRRETSDWSSARRPCPQVLQRHHGVAKGASDRSLARPPCPQLPQGHPGVAKSHLTKDKPVSARCKDRLSYRRAYRQTCRMVSYVGLSDHQTGLPYRQPYLKLSPAGSHGSSLPPTLPAALPVVRPTASQTGLPYRPALPAALPEALAGRVTWVILTGWFYTPDLPNASSTARPASLTSSPTGQPHQLTRPAS